MVYWNVSLKGIDHPRSEQPQNALEKEKQESIFPAPVPKARMGGENFL